MKDTAPAIERKFWAMLLERSGEERLKMGCSMHATAQALAKAALLQSHYGIHPGELRRRLFLHFYGAGFAPEQRNRIAAALSKSAKSSEATRVGAVSEPAKSKTRARVAERPAAYRNKRKVK
jgi:hypothetical protein